MQEDKNTEEYVKYSDLEGKGNGNWKEKTENFLNSKYFVPIIIILIAVIAFCLGRISGLQEKRPAVRVLNSVSENNPLNPPYIKGETEQDSNVKQTAAVSASVSGGQVVASKSGTKYHYPWCAGAKQISAKNLITFNSIEEARAKGYTPASNCKGLK